MNKDTFIWILQCALLSWDGMDEYKMVYKYGAEPREARTGIKLCEYLKSIKTEAVVKQKSK